jgi:hypothetical protein
MNQQRNTKKANRRKLWFHSCEELIQELAKIEQAEREGKLVTVGNWTPGQVFSHIASWIEYGWSGYPIGAPPWFIKWILVWMGRRHIKHGMPAGVKIPGIKEGTVGQDMATFADGLSRLRHAIARLDSREPIQFDSPAFGPMSHEDRIQLNLRHAELHLGYLQY